MVWTLRTDEEKNNEIIADTELTGRTDVELAVLFHMVSQALADAKPGTPARRTVIASLQNISKARADRHYRCTAPGI